MGNDGALRYHVGVAFDALVVLADAPDPESTSPAEKPLAHAERDAPRPVSSPVPGVVRNRW
jgi:hypothetical protein